MNPLDLPWYVVDDGKPEPDDYDDQYNEWLVEQAELQARRLHEPA